MPMPRCAPSLLVTLLTPLLLAARLGAAAPATEDPTAMNRIAESYVKLALAVGQHDPDYVDAFYGPPEWRAEAAVEKRPLAEIRAAAAALIADLAAHPVPGNGDEMVRLRHDYLLAQLRSLAARVDLLGGKKMTFDEESKALYDAVAPTYDAAHFQGILDRLAKLLPGQGPLAPRLEAYRQRFAIPNDRLNTVFQAAIAECRRRTARHVQLPAGESFVVEYVTGKPWAGYNWYKGKFHSVIQVNTELPVFIDRAVDLACHEGYPGHHTYNALLEKHLVLERGWPETSVYPLFSPQSLIAEGSANYGIDMAFPGAERSAFESRVLFPLAGLDPAQAATYYLVLELLHGLAYARNEAARGYLDGKMDRAAALDWLARYSLLDAKRAEQQLRFITQYRTYVINYNYGQDLVKAYVERQAGAANDRRWQVFERLISSPRLPSGLQ
jgi:hypothetical protein